MPDFLCLSRLARLLPSKRGDDAVLSLGVQARIFQPPRVQPKFEVLVRHLFDRLLNNEAFGEDAGLRVSQLAYAIVLPGILVALFLFPAYHGLPPHPHERPFWSQASDHLFYVTYAFVILGIAMIFQWDLLFPDLLDVFVLSSLPIPKSRLLFGRVSAFAIFLAFVLLGTTGLTDIFFPAVADLHCGFWRHFAAHTAAVSISGMGAALFLIALQGVLLCLPGRRLHSRITSVVKTLSVVALLIILFLFPLTAHYLPALLGSGLQAIRWFPPFWFLGLYHLLLYGEAAQPVFRELARTGLVATAVFASIASLTYPIAYARRVRHLIEGAPLQAKRFQFGAAPHALLHSILLRSARPRATFHLVAQTLMRLERLHLYLSMYAGLGLAIVISGLVVLNRDAEGIHLAVSTFGIRSAVPVLAFWVVAGLRTALLSPLGQQGSWIFRVIQGPPQLDDLCGAEIFVRAAAITLTLLAVGVLLCLAPPNLASHADILGHVSFTFGQIIVAIGLSMTLTDLFFLTVRSIPFTAKRMNSTRELPLTLVRYFVLFPAFVLETVALEPWIEASTFHLLLTVVGFVMVHAALLQIKKLILRQQRPETELPFATLDLHGD